MSHTHKNTQRESARERERERERERDYTHTTHSRTGIRLCAMSLSHTLRTLHMHALPQTPTQTKTCVFKQRETHRKITKRARIAFSRVRVCQQHQQQASVARDRDCRMRCHLALLSADLARLGLASLGSICPTPCPASMIVCPIRNPK
jgi:hypothetical protein